MHKDIETMTSIHTKPQFLLIVYQIRDTNEI